MVPTERAGDPLAELMGESAAMVALRAQVRLLVRRPEDIDAPSHAR